MTGSSRNSKRRAWGFAFGGVLAGVGVIVAITAASAQYLRPGYGNFGRGPSVNIGPSIHYSPNVVPSIGDPVVSSRPPRPPQRTVGDPGDPPPGGGSKAGRSARASGGNNTFVPNEVLVLFSNSVGDGRIDDLARQYRLTRLETQNLPLIDASIVRFRIPRGRTVPTTVNGIQIGGDIQIAQPNFRFRLQQQGAAVQPASAPAQYPAVKLRLPEAHAAATGVGVVVAVIDSGVDARHVELSGAVTESYDALASREGPHAHGTGIAGAIVARGRAVGSAPAARILAIRAFGVAGGSAESTSFSILKSIDFAAGHGARVINMSFAGPHDPLLQRAMTAADARGIVLVAAAGNAGPSSPPLYPAAYREVVAVTATDAGDRLFDGANRGKHIAVAAPGVDVFLPAPAGKYQITTGTSFAAAYVSGVAALMLQRNPQLAPADVRARLAATARDLGPKGRDEQFGAGLTDAASAVSASAGTPVTAVTAGSPAR